LLDDLYRSHPSEFVAARDELAKKLREGGEREDADRVKKLRRPSAAAWLLNLVALARPKALKEFAKASGDLEKAQTRALEGKDEGAAKWRAAAAREREAAEAVIDAAEKAASDAGHPATKQALDLVDGTLRAAAAHPELRERVVAGRLEREQTGATIGAAGLVAAPPSSSKRQSPAKERDSARKREVAQAAREVKHLERLITEAEAREVRRQAEVDAAAEALRREKADLAAAKKETTSLRRELKAAQKRAKR
jgi:hypothetical protein